jgi:hypothetical protein
VYVRAYGNGTFEMKPGFSPKMALPGVFDPSEWHFFRSKAGYYYRYAAFTPPRFTYFVPSVAISFLFFSSYFPP